MNVLSDSARVTTIGDHNAHMIGLADAMTAHVAQAMTKTCHAEFCQDWDGFARRVAVHCEHRWRLVIVTANSLFSQDAMQAANIHAIGELIIGIRQRTRESPVFLAGTHARYSEEHVNNAWDDIAIRTLLRHRDTLVEGAAACIQRMQKALTLMNLQLHTVISDVTGVTGMLILRDIVAGMTDPAVLARHRHPQCRASEAEIAASLTGHSRDEHLFVLRQELEVYDCYHEKIRRGDEQIETRVHARQAQCEPPGRALPASRKPSPTSKRQDHTPSFEIRSPLFTLCGGVDLTALPGLGPYGGCFRHQVLVKRA